VPDDLSPLQLQATGTFEKRRFTLIGRIRKSWAEGSWNEWCAQFDDHRLGWLAEAQGDLVMTFESDPHTVAPEPTPEWLRNLDCGCAVRIGGRPFSVSEVKEVNCTAAEGELTQDLSGGRPMTSVDLHGPGLEFATIESAGGRVSLFVGRFVEFDECRFTGLRSLEGWGPQATPISQ
jgi:hypothetical protein